MDKILDQLVQMSRQLADPKEDLVILSEGNTSADADGESFWVKASGTELIRANRESFVRVQSATVIAAFDRVGLTDEEVRELLRASTVEGDKMPSVETFMHAFCLQLDGVRFVGHTHPTAALGLLTSQRSRELFEGSLFPDHIVLLGPSYPYIPYTDPGLPLAVEIRRHVNNYMDREGRVPHVIWMENHGVIVLGGTAQEVVNISRMLVKTCRILAATLLAGGPRFLSAADVRRIDKRPDELDRRRDLV